MTDAQPVDERSTTAESPWPKRVEALLEQALEEQRAGRDPLSSIMAAEWASRIEQGEAPAETMDGYPFPGEDDPTPCTCPPNLAERGGWSSRCPAHGRSHW